MNGHLLRVTYWTAGAGITFGIALGWHLAGWGLTNLVILILIGWVTWLHLDRVNVHERADDASDTADLALGKVEAVENHLSGLEPPSAGRHARPRPTPAPRAVA